MLEGQLDGIRRVGRLPQTALSSEAGTYPDSRNTVPQALKPKIAAHTIATHQPIRILVSLNWRWITSVKATPSP
jgi:hypothetical protein